MKVQIGKRGEKRGMVTEKEGSCIGEKGERREHWLRKGKKMVLIGKEG